MSWRVEHQTFNSHRREMKSFAIFALSLAIIASVDADCGQCLQMVGDFYNAMSSPKGLDLQIKFIKNKGCTMFADQDNVDDCNGIIEEYFPQVIQALGNDPEAASFICSQVASCEEGRAEYVSNRLCQKLVAFTNVVFPLANLMLVAMDWSTLPPCGKMRTMPNWLSIIYLEMDSACNWMMPYNQRVRPSCKIMSPWCSLF